MMSWKIMSGDDVCLLMVVMVTEVVAASTAVSTSCWSSFSGSNPKKSFLPYLSTQQR